MPSDGLVNAGEQPAVLSGLCAAPVCEGGYSTAGSAAWGLGWGQTSAGGGAKWDAAGYVTAGRAQVRHNNGAYAASCCLKPWRGCGLSDYDADGWQDILLITGMDCMPRPQRRTLRLFRNNRNALYDVTRSAARSREYGMAWRRRLEHDGFPDLRDVRPGRTGVRNTGKGIRGVTSGGTLGRTGFSTSALWSTSTGGYSTLRL